MQNLMRSGTVDRTWTVGEIVATYPSAAEVMLAHGLHCVGCGVQYDETLEEGARGHGMDEAEIEQIVNEINSAAQDMKVSETRELSVTGNAVQKIKEMLTARNKAGAGLRIAVAAGGCSGQSYRLSFEEKAQPGDQTIEVEGVKFFLDGENLPVLHGIAVDYVDSLQGAGFKISNPNAKRSCGCGQSFG
ncbi:MAG: iron-sulfur cluster assembly accessory protein [Candidatus Diapherotrites archaeon]|nr:iron-sulfur cluster assembly accessory protein [Candidatus Diapherotrites archaeon]